MLLILLTWMNHFVMSNYAWAEKNNSNKKTVESSIVRPKWIKCKAKWKHIMNTPWLINSLSYSLIMECATSETQIASHLIGVLFGCTTCDTTTEVSKWCRVCLPNNTKKQCSKQWKLLHLTTGLSFNVLVTAPAFSYWRVLLVLAISSLIIIQTLFMGLY